MQAHARVPAARSALPRPARYPSRLRASTIIPPSRLGDNNCRRGGALRRTRRGTASVVRASAGDQESTPRDVSAGAQPRDVSASAVVTSDVGTAYDVRMPSYARTGKNFLNISIPTLLNADLGSVMDAPSCALTPKKTHIVCTLGPSSRTVDDLEKLLGEVESAGGRRQTEISESEVAPVRVAFTVDPEGNASENIQIMEPASAD